MKWQNKEIRCKCCDSLFMTTSPASKFCSKECSRIYNLEKHRTYFREYRNKKKPKKYCNMCGKLLKDNRANYHEACMHRYMIKEYDTKRFASQYDKIVRLYMQNNGYSKSDIKNLKEEYYK